VFGRLCLADFAHALNTRTITHFYLPVLCHLYEHIQSAFPHHSATSSSLSSSSFLDTYIYLALKAFLILPPRSSLSSSSFLDTYIRLALKAFLFSFQTLFKKTCMPTCYIYFLSNRADNSLEANAAIPRFNMCTQDVRKLSNCGCIVKVGSVKDCDKKGTDDCKGVTDNPISYWSGWSVTINLRRWALRIIRFHIGQVGAVIINLRRWTGTSNRNELFWDYVSTNLRRWTGISGRNELSWDYISTKSFYIRANAKYTVSVDPAWKKCRNCASCLQSSGRSR